MDLPLAVWQLYLTRTVRSRERLFLLHYRLGFPLGCRLSLGAIVLGLLATCPRCWFFRAELLRARCPSGGRLLLDDGRHIL